MHPSEIDVKQGLYNDLSHLKWKTGNGDGHIWFGRPDTTGDSIHYVSQRTFDALVAREKLTSDELNELGIYVGGNLLAPNGSHKIEPGTPLPGENGPRPRPTERF